MSTGSATSDAEDDETRSRRAVISSEGPPRRATRFDPDRFSEEDLEDERSTEQERDGVSRTHQKEARQSQRNAANARERARMRVLSKAFSRLKTSLPWVPADTKLSKLDTLRLASSYICHLRQLLQEDRLQDHFVHPVNLTWPFLISGRPEEDISSTGRLCGATA
ncbi:musculin [Menidia menidia]